jgi:hypothetical protein
MMSFVTYDMSAMRRWAIVFIHAFKRDCFVSTEPSAARVACIERSDCPTSAERERDFVTGYHGGRSSENCRAGGGNGPDAEE